MERRFGKWLLTVTQDEFPTSPREDDNFGTMVCFHRDYTLGDTHSYKEPEDFLESLAELADAGYAAAEPAGRNGSRRAAILKKCYVILPLYLYDHSGITMNTTGFSCRWDSMQVGWIYVTKADILANWGGKYLTKKLRKWAEEYLRDEVGVYDQYLTGDIHEYAVIADDGETADSLCGCYGYDYCCQEGLYALIFADDTLQKLAMEYEVAPAWAAGDGKGNIRGVEYLLDRADIEGDVSGDTYDAYCELLREFHDVCVATNKRR